MPETSAYLTVSQRFQSKHLCLHLAGKTATQKSGILKRLRHGLVKKNGAIYKYCLIKLEGHVLPSRGKIRTTLSGTSDRDNNVMKTQTKTKISRSRAYET